MMAARRLRGFGWLALIFFAVLGCYLVSLQVAVERNRLGEVNAAILGTRHEIRQLETEFATRSSLRQLERWNGETLALSAPQEGQYLKGERQLASFDGGMLPDADGASPTMLALVAASDRLPAEVVTASDVAPAAALPLVQAVTAAATPTATLQRAVVTTPTPAVRVSVQKVASAPKPAATKPAQTARQATRPAPADPVMARMAAADTRRAQRMAMLDSKLLGDLAREARAEASAR